MPQHRQRIGTRSAAPCAQDVYEPPEQSTATALNRAGRSTPAAAQPATQASAPAEPGPSPTTPPSADPEAGPTPHLALPLNPFTTDLISTQALRLGAAFVALAREQLGAHTWRLSSTRRDNSGHQATFKHAEPGDTNVLPFEQFLAHCQQRGVDHGRFLNDRPKYGFLPCPFDHMVQQPTSHERAASWEAILSSPNLRINCADFVLRTIMQLVDAGWVDLSRDQVCRALRHHAAAGLLLIPSELRQHCTDGPIAPGDLVAVEMECGRWAHVGIAEEAVRTPMQNETTEAVAAPMYDARISIIELNRGAPDKNLSPHVRRGNLHDYPRAVIKFIPLLVVLRYIRFIADQVPTPPLADPSGPQARRTKKKRKRIRKRVRRHTANAVADRVAVAVAATPEGAQNGANKQRTVAFPNGLYQGEWQRRPAGWGTFESHGRDDAGKPLFAFTGTWSKGVPAQGRLLEQGLIEEGRFEAGELTGLGSRVYPSGVRVHGNFKRGVLQGHCWIAFPADHRHANWVLSAQPKRGGQALRGCFDGPFLLQASLGDEAKLSYHVQFKQGWPVSIQRIADTTGADWTKTAAAIAELGFKLSALAARVPYRTNTAGSVQWGAMDIRGLQQSWRQGWWT